MAAPEPWWVKFRNVRPSNTGVLAREQMPWPTKSEPSRIVLAASISPVSARALLTVRFLFVDPSVAVSW